MLAIARNTWEKAQVIPVDPDHPARRWLAARNLWRPVFPCLAQPDGSLQPLRHKSVATFRLTNSALAAVHRSTGYQDPTDNEGVRKVTAGIARVNGRPQRKAKPLTEAALAAVKAAVMQPRRHQGRAVRAENAWAARRRGQVG